MSSNNKDSIKLEIPRKTVETLLPKKTISKVAIELGISQPYLSLIISGKRKLNPRNNKHVEIFKRLQKI